MTQWEPETVISFLLGAGSTALAYYGRMAYQYKSDNTLVTEADTRIEKLASGLFDKPEEGVYLIGEETIAEKPDEYVSRALEGNAWILDPIDGTAAFANHVPTWGISLAFAESGHIRHGGIYIPVSGELCLTCGTEVLFGVVESSSPNISPADLRPLTAPSRPFDAGGMISLSQHLTKNGIIRLPNPIHVIASCVYSLLNLVLGSYVAYLARVKLWDIAGCLPILHNLGCTMNFRSGRTLDCLIDDGSYRLDPISPEQWLMTEDACFGWTEDAVARVLQAVG